VSGEQACAPQQPDEASSSGRLERGERACASSQQPVSRLYSASVVQGVCGEGAHPLSLFSWLSKKWRRSTTAAYSALSTRICSVALYMQTANCVCVCEGGARVAGAAGGRNRPAQE